MVRRPIGPFFPAFGPSGPFDTVRPVRRSVSPSVRFLPGAVRLVRSVRRSVFYRTRSVWSVGPSVRFLPDPTAKTQFCQGSEAKCLVKLSFILHGQALLSQRPSQQSQGFLTTADNRNESPETTETPVG